MTEMKTVVIGAAAAAGGALVALLIMGALYDRASDAPVGADVENAVSSSPALEPPPRSAEARYASPGPGYPHVNDESEHRRETERVRQSIVSKNEARWAADATAQAEAAKLEQKLMSAAASDGVTALPFQPDRMQVACKRSMCRIESDFPPGSSSGEWTTRMLLMLGGEIASSQWVAETLPNGAKRSVLYAYRVGHAPPG
jgi:hypothetical protein